jgi:hypothetical protein
VRKWERKIEFNANSSFWVRVCGSSWEVLRTVSVTVNHGDCRAGVVVEGGARCSALAEPPTLKFKVLPLCLLSVEWIMK